MIALFLALAMPHDYPVEPGSKMFDSDRCVAIDGDTMVCLYKGRRLHVQLNGIDAPELPTPEGIQAKVQLSSYIKNQPVHWLDLGTDRWGRRVAEVSVTGTDINCLMLRNHLARYWPSRDRRKTLQTNCPK